MPTLLQQRGTSLVEVLIALLLCALTGMAVAKGLVLSLHQTLDHKLDVLAQTLANDFVERSYANRSAALAGLYTMGAAVPNSIHTCEERACTPIDMAAHDLAQWSQKQQQLLPGSEVLVTVQNRRYTLSLTWYTRLAGPEPAHCALTAHTGQRCLQLVWDV